MTWTGRIQGKQHDLLSLKLTSVLLLPHRTPGQGSGLQSILNSEATPED